MEFRDIYKKYTPDIEETISPDTIYFTKDKKTLEELFDGYRTFTASNRGVGSKQLFTADTSSDGSVFLTQKYTSRVIEIEGQIQKDLNATLDRMNKYFSEEEISFSFYDEKQFEFKGIFQISQVEEGSNTPMIKISIQLTNPFKYANDTYTLNAGTPFNIISNIGICDANGGYRPTRISFTADMTSNITFTVKSTDNRRNGKHIKLTPYAGTHSGYIDFDKGGQLFIGGALSNTYLDISSDLFSFVLNNGDTIETNATTCSAEFKMKGV